MPTAERDSSAPTCRVVDIHPDEREDTEQLGSKPKFWVLIDGQRWLFKEARPNTGEDWSEKVVAEIAAALGFSAASVQLASFGDRRGCISRNFVDVAAGEALVHGNEILSLRVTGYDPLKTFRQADHTLQNIVDAIRGLFGADAEDALKQLATYLVLDALVGNTDRHHENWGLRVGFKQDYSLSIEVAPSFDHASSLGRELLDTRRTELLDAQRVANYVRRGRGGIFKNAQEKHGENPLTLVEEAARAYPDYFQPALTRVDALTPDTIGSILSPLPEERMSLPAKRFAECMLLNARSSLIALLK